MPDELARRAVDYSDAWRTGVCDGLGKAIRVALRAGHRSVAVEIAVLGLDLFGSHFAEHLRLKRYEEIAGEVLAAWRT